jgi:hypothetical protein
MVGRRGKLKVKQVAGGCESKWSSWLVLRRQQRPRAESRLGESNLIPVQRRQKRLGWTPNESVVSQLWRVKEQRSMLSQEYYALFDSRRG